MSLADIELTNLDTEPIFNDQVLNTVRSIIAIYPEIQPNLYLLDESGFFNLYALPFGRQGLVEMLSKDASTFIILESQKEYTSYKVKTDQLQDLFTEGNSSSQYSIISPVSYVTSIYIYIYIYICSAPLLWSTLGGIFLYTSLFFSFSLSLYIYIYTCVMSPWRAIPASKRDRR